MSTFWSKIAMLLVVIVGIFFAIKHFSSSDKKPVEEQKSFYDIAKEDDKRLRTEPESIEPAAAVEKAAEPVKPAKPVFRELSDIEDIEAQRLFEVAIKARSMGRLQTGFKLMVDTCRQIIEKFPDSVYAFKAKRLLREMPKRFWARYKITEEEVDLGNFK